VAGSFFKIAHSFHWFCGVMDAPRTWQGLGAIFVPVMEMSRFARGIQKPSGRFPFN